METDTTEIDGDSAVSTVGGFPVPSDSSGDTTYPDPTSTTSVSDTWFPFPDPTSTTIGTSWYPDSPTVSITSTASGGGPSTPRVTTASPYPTLRLVPSTPATKANESNLSASAAAGVGIGATLAVVLLVLAGWMLVRRRRGRRLMGGPAYRRRSSCPPIVLRSMCPKIGSSKKRAVELDAGTSEQSHELPAVQPVYTKDRSPLIELE